MFIDILTENTENNTRTNKLELRFGRGVKNAAVHICYKGRQGLLF